MLDALHRARADVERDARVRRVLADRELQVRQVPSWVSYARPARLDTGTCNLTRMGQCSVEFHMLRPPCATPASATAL